MPRMEIKVTPNASRDEILEKGGKIVVKVRTAPEKGKANAACLKLLKEKFGQQVRIVSGERSRRKFIEF